MFTKMNSINKGADILRAISEGFDRISDLSNKLNMNKSTIHRLLKSLENSRMVCQDPITRRYHLGYLILELSSRPIISHQNLIFCAFDHLKYLRDFTQETVVLHIRIGLERICLEELQSFENIKYTAGKGVIAPIYVGSAGKILLSELNNNELQILLRNLHLAPMSANTITNQEVLLNEIEKAKNQGYAISFGERVAGSASISVPIKSYICPVAMSILGPDNRFTLKKMMETLELMKERAILISRKLAVTNRVEKEE